MRDSNSFLFFFSGVLGTGSETDELTKLLFFFLFFLCCMRDVDGYVLCAAMIRHRRQSTFEDAALEWLDGQHRDEVQRGLAQEGPAHKSN